MDRDGYVRVAPIWLPTGPRGRGYLGLNAHDALKRDEATLVAFDALGQWTCVVVSGSHWNGGREASC